VSLDPQLLDTAVTAAGLPARYLQPHRRYHTLVHIEQVLRTVDELSPDLADVTALRLAAWFHDAIYAPGRSDNEERSAFLAKDTLELVGAPPALGAQVARLVLLTASHDPQPNDLPGALLCDADLSVLGSPADEYDSYASAIREEYELVPDDTFRAGRAKILDQFLARPYLFHTSNGRERWEDVARANIEREIAELKGPKT
jgi:predicted metal-dependent HD superfamily phosphohydrolase